MNSQYGSIAVVTYRSSLQELLLAGFAILRLASPCFEGRCLQGTAVGEGNGPWPVQRAFVHGVQVDGRILLTLATRQEGDAWCDIWRKE